jgi:hypothetical protein
MTELKLYMPRGLCRTSGMRRIVMFPAFVDLMMLGHRAERGMR